MVGIPKAKAPAKTTTKPTGPTASKTTHTAVGTKTAEHKVPLLIEVPDYMLSPEGQQMKEDIIARMPKGQLKVNREYAEAVEAQRKELLVRLSTVMITEPYAPPSLAGVPDKWLTFQGRQEKELQIADNRLIEMSVPDTKSAQPASEKKGRWMEVPKLGNINGSVKVFRDQGNTSNRSLWMVESKRFWSDENPPYVVMKGIPNQNQVYIFRDLLRYCHGQKDLDSQYNNEPRSPQTLIDDMLKDLQARGIKVKVSELDHPASPTQLASTMDGLRSVSDVRQHDGSAVAPASSVTAEGRLAQAVFL